MKDCIICDLDGTLALFGNRRSPYDASRCDETDEVCEPVHDILGMADDACIDIILMSGRDSKYREPTERWLRKNNISYTSLFMRAESDNRKDSIVKTELYEQHVKDKYKVLYVLDDRLSVIRDCWQKLGLFVFICNQEMREF